MVEEAQMALPANVVLAAAAAFIVVPVFIVLLVRRLRVVKTLDDFVVAGRRMPLALVTAAVTSYYIWGSSVEGSAEGAHFWGISGCWIYPLYSAGLWIFGLWAIRYRKIFPTVSGAYTEWFKVRFAGARGASLLHALAVIYAILTSIFGALCATTAAGHAIAGLTGRPDLYWIGVVMSSAFSVIYTVTSGLWGTVLFSWILTMVAMPLCAVTGAMAWAAIGGPSRILGLAQSAIEAGRLSPQFLNLLNPVAIVQYLPCVLAWAWFSLPMQQDYWQVAIASDSPKTASKGFLHSGNWWFFMPFLSSTLGFAYAVLTAAGEVPPVPVGTQAYAALVGRYLPPVFTFIFLYLIYAAVIDNVGVASLAVGTLLGTDLYKIFNKRATDQQIKTVVRIGTAAAVVVICLSTIHPISTLYLLLFMPMYMAPLVGGFLLSLWRGWVHPLPLFVGGIVGFAVGTYLFIFRGIWGPSMLIAFAIGLVFTMLSLIKPMKVDLEALRAKLSAPGA